MNNQRDEVNCKKIECIGNVIRAHHKNGYRNDKLYESYRGKKIKNEDRYKTWTECQYAYDKYYWALLKLVEMFGLEKMSYFTFTFANKKDATRHNIAAGIRYVIRNLRKKGRVYKNRALKVSYAMKYEYQANGALHIHVVFIFETEVKAPKDIVGKVTKWWKQGVAQNGGVGGYFKHSKINSADALLDYMKKNDFDNTQENTRQLTRFKHCDQLYSFSKNLKIPQCEVYVSEDELMQIYKNSKIKNFTGHYYYNRHHELQYTLTYSYHEIPDSLTDSLDNICPKLKKQIPLTEKSSAKFIVKEVKHLLSICRWWCTLVSSLCVFLFILCFLFVRLLD